MSFSRISDIFLVVGFLLWWSIHLFFYSDTYVIEHYAPGMPALALYIVAAGIVVSLRDPALRLFGAVWVAWPVIGTYLAVGQLDQRRLPFQVDYANGNLIYYFSIIAMLAAIRAVLFFYPLPQNNANRRQLTLMEAAPLLLFVPLFVLDLRSSGSTLLSGENIVREMYSVDRGFIYNFRTIMILEITFLFILMRRSQNMTRIIVTVLLVISIVIGVLDGKRVIGLLAILNCLYAALILSKKNRGAGKAAVAIVMTLLAYGFVGNLRADRDTSIGSGWSDVATIAGVEYRDYIYSVNQWSPEYIQALGYDYIGSAVATLVNQKVLEAIGADKNSLVQSDSARTWQRAFQTEDGIRIGLVGELYFAFPKYYIVAMILFGFFAAAIRISIANTRTEFGFIVMLTQFSLVTLAVFSQSTVTFGTVLTLVYIYFAMWLWRQFLLVCKNVLPAGQLAFPRRDHGVSASQRPEKLPTTT